MSAHTPGPWDDASKYPEIPSVRIFAKSHYIATVGNSDDSREQTEANARLIAAAPELLGLIKWVEENCNGALNREDVDYNSRVVLATIADNCAKLIAAAEGQS